MTDIDKAMLGDHEASKRLTDAGVLLPCPFCGSNAMADYDAVRPFEWAVFCEACGVMPLVSESEHDARLAWNTRAPILSESELKKLEETT